MGKSSNCLKNLYFSIGMHYEGTVYSEYLSCPQVHLTIWGDVLQSAQSKQAVLWVVGIQIIHLLDRYHSIYLVEGTHTIFWMLQCSSPCKRACLRCAQNVILFSHMLQCTPRAWDTHLLGTAHIATSNHVQSLR